MSSDKGEVGLDWPRTGASQEGESSERASNTGSNPVPRTTYPRRSNQLHVRFCKIHWNVLDRPFRQHEPVNRAR